MSLGIKVLINTKDDNNHTITEYGYIMRQIDANLYEIYGENSQTIYILRSSDFTELK